MQTCGRWFFRRAYRPPASDQRTIDGEKPTTLGFFNWYHLVFEWRHWSHGRSDGDQMVTSPTMWFSFGSFICLSIRGFLLLGWHFQNTIFLYCCHFFSKPMAGTDQYHPHHRSQCKRLINKDQLTVSSAGRLILASKGCALILVKCLVVALTSN